jgi:hypothetical protein
MSDIAQRFREEARLTEEDCSVELINLQYRAQAGEDIRWDKVSAVIKNAQLNKALSTKLDNGRYVLALIDTKGELPRVLYERYEPGFHERVEYIVAKKTQENMQRAGFAHKVVHVFGEKE